MGFDKRDNAKPYVPQEGDTLQTIAERETDAGTPLSWQDLARFNWGTDDQDEVNAFLRDDLGCRHRDADNNFVISTDDQPQGELLIPVPFQRNGLSLERTYTLRVRKKTAPPQLLECCHLPGVTFAFDSSFIRPNVVGYLKKLEAVADRHPGAKVMLFGHTDAVGDDLYNKKLSERRAWSVYAFITNDPDAWEVLYTGEDWGLAVIQEILADLGHDPGPIDGDWGTQTRTAMRSFLGLPEDALVQNDAAFRKHLFAAYMASKHDVELPPERFMDPGYMGCSEFNPVEEGGGAQEENRRVTFFFFHANRLPTLPCAFADVAPCKQQVTASGPRFKDAFRCSFFDSLARPCGDQPPPPVVTPTIHFVEVAPPLEGVADLGPVDVWGGANFSPPLGHHVHFRVEVRDLPPGFKGTAQLEIVRRTDEASKPFVVVVQLDESVSGEGNQQVLFTWQGKADRHVEAHLSDRTTPHQGLAKVLHIPVREILKGDWVHHGLYHVRRVTLVEETGTQVDEDLPQHVAVGVPVLVTLRFNTQWRADVIDFGLEHFREQIELGIRAYCQTAYAKVGANVRFLFDATRTDETPPDPSDLDEAITVTVDAGWSATGEVPLPPERTFLVDIGGVDNPISFDDDGNKVGRVGTTNPLITDIDMPEGLRHIVPDLNDSQNLFVNLDGLYVSRIFVTQLIFFNDWSYWKAQRAKFRVTFYPLGVRTSTSKLWTDSGVTRTRWEGGPALNPKRALTSKEAQGFTVTLSTSGMASVTPAQTGSKKATKRAAQIERALRRFVRMVGNTVVHELGHALGLVAPRRKEDGTWNAVELSDHTRVTAPLVGTKTGHTASGSGYDIMSDGGRVPFVEYIETAEFNASNGQYLKDCLPQA